MPFLTKNYLTFLQTISYVRIVNLFNQAQNFDLTESHRLQIIFFYQVVDYLVNKMEYDVNQPTSDGKTALQFAIENNHLAVVKVLLGLCASITQQERKALAEIDNPEIQEFLQRPTGILPNLT